MDTEARKALRLSRIVAEDQALPTWVRDEANRLEALAESKPGLVLERLEDMGSQIIPMLERFIPIRSYVRFITIDVFYEHHLRRCRRGFFRGPEDYRRHLEGRHDKGAAAWDDLQEEDPLVPAIHSWLVPATRVAGLDGAEAKSHLRIEGDPPYIVMFFPTEAMRASGVRIRAPRGIDAVPSRHLLWSPGGVPDECIDQDIPLSALGHLEWRA